jgi:hypothetical protein
MTGGALRARYPAWLPNSYADCLLAVPPAHSYGASALRCLAVLLFCRLAVTARRQDALLLRRAQHALHFLQ